MAIKTEMLEYRVISITITSNKINKILNVYLFCGFFCFSIQLFQLYLHQYDFEN